MRSSKTLQDLDSYLRAIWLECCGHMSEFSLGGAFVRAVGMRRKIAEVFQPGSELTHSLRLWDKFRNASQMH